MRELEQTREAYGPTRQFYQAMADHRNNVVPNVATRMEIWLVTSQRYSRGGLSTFNESLNDRANEQLEASHADSVMLLPPSIEETRKAIRRLKNNKAPGTRRNCS